MAIFVFLGAVPSIVLALRDHDRYHLVKKQRHAIGDALIALGQVACARCVPEGLSL